MERVCSLSHYEPFALESCEKESVIRNVLGELIAAIAARFCGVSIVVQYGVESLLNVELNHCSMWS